MKVRVMDIKVEDIYDLNQKLEKDSSHTKALELFRAMDETLLDIEYTLIETAGGWTEEKGDYFNLPAYSHVEKFFYQKTGNKQNGILWLYNSLASFVESYDSMYPENDLANKLALKFHHLDSMYGGLSDTENLFKNLSLDEAVEILEGFRKEIALELTRYLIQKQ